MDWFEFVLSILSGLAVAIPLLLKLVEYVQKAAREKNWAQIVELTIEYMTMAETKFENGADRKEWVMGMIQTSAKGIEYDLDEAALAKISAMIDSICAASKEINVASV